MAGTLDLSGWVLRNEERKQSVDALLARVEKNLPEVQQLLRDGGVREGYLFGSVAAGRARPDSDVDVAVSGSRPEGFYRLAADVERALGLPVDLLDLDRAPAQMAAAIRRDGRRIFP